MGTSTLRNSTAVAIFSWDYSPEQLEVVFDLVFQDLIEPPPNEKDVADGEPLQTLFWHLMNHFLALMASGQFKEIESLIISMRQTLGKYQHLTIENAKTLCVNIQAIAAFNAQYLSINNPLKVLTILSSGKRRVWRKRLIAIARLRCCSIEKLVKKGVFPSRASAERMLRQMRKEYLVTTSHYNGVTCYTIDYRARYALIHLGDLRAKREKKSS